MPRKKNYKKKYKRKRRYKRRDNNSAVLSFKNTLPLGRTFKTKLRYAEQVTLNGGISTFADFVFTANGLYDPSVSGAGHQPYGFDQIMPMYDHYTVIGAKCHVTFYNTDTSIPQLVGIVVRDNNTSITNIEDTIEGASAKTMMTGTSGSSRDTVSLTYTLNPNKYLGVSKPMASHDVRGGVGSNPAEQCYFHIVAGGSPGIADAQPVYASVLIEYVAVFSEPKILGGS